MLVLTNSTKLGCLSGRHAVDIVSSEELLHEKCDENRYSVIIVDIDKAEGVYSSRALKMTGSNLPIIGITEDLQYHENWTEHKTVFIEQGGDYLLRGPVNPQELLSCIGALVRRFNATRSAIYLCDRRLLFNVFQRAITFDGEMIHFTSKERMVVFELADHFGQIRSKDQILNALYYLTPEDEPELKIIDVFICKARKKLDNLDPHLNLGTVIQTVWGRGYRLVDIKSEVKVAS